MPNSFLSSRFPSISLGFPRLSPTFPDFRSDTAPPGPGPAAGSPSPFFGLPSSPSVATDRRERRPPPTGAGNDQAGFRRRPQADFASRPQADFASRPQADFASRRQADPACRAGAAKSGPAAPLPGASRRRIPATSSGSARFPAISCDFRGLSRKPRKPRKRNPGTKHAAPGPSGSAAPVGGGVRPLRRKRRLPETVRPVRAAAVPGRSAPRFGFRASLGASFRGGVLPGRPDLRPGAGRGVEIRGRPLQGSAGGSVSGQQAMK